MESVEIIPILNIIIGHNGEININASTQAKIEYDQYVSSLGIYGTFVELYAATKLFNFIGIIFKKKKTKNGYDCYEFGTSDNNIKDNLKPWLHVLLFTGPTDTISLIVDIWNYWIH